MASPLKQNLDELKSMFPNIAEVAELFDCTVRVDITAADDDPNATKPLYFLGTPQELAAGLYAQEYSPTFDHLEELEQWCRKHFAKYNRIANDNNGDGVVDFSLWEQHGN